MRFVGVNVVPRDAHKLGRAAGRAPTRSSPCGRSRTALGEAGWRAPDGWRERALRRARALGAGAGRRTWRRAPDERMTQGQVLRALNEVSRAATTGWWWRPGTPHVDVHKLWEPARGGRCLMEVGFSCMGGEIPAALGVRMAQPDAGEVYVVIGDGTYLMGNTGELVTARQEGLKLTVIVVENDGYQSIHGLQRSPHRPQLRARVPRALRRRDGAGGAIRGGRLRGQRPQPRLRGLAWPRPSTSSATRSMPPAREPRPVVIVARVEPQRLLLDSDCWWDVGVAELSERAETRELAAEHARGRALQRHYSSTP